MKKKSSLGVAFVIIIAAALIMGFSSCATTSCVTCNTCPNTVNMAGYN